MIRGIWADAVNVRSCHHHQQHHHNDIYSSCAWREKCNCFIRWCDRWTFGDILDYSSEVAPFRTIKRIIPKSIASSIFACDKYFKRPYDSIRLFRVRREKKLNNHLTPCRFEKFSQIIVVKSFDSIRIRT